MCLNLTRSGLPTRYFVSIHAQHVRRQLHAGTCVPCRILQADGRVDQTSEPVPHHWQVFAHVREQAAAQ